MIRRSYLKYETWSASWQADVKRSWSPARCPRFPQAVVELESEADAHLARGQGIRRELKAERERIADRDNLVRQLEAYVFDALMSSGFPALSRSDTLHISRRNWMAYITRTAMRVYRTR
jgi:hypothetical protein